MTQQEYEQKRAELWYEYAAMLRRNCIPIEAFDYIFDRAYALGKQEKDAEETKADGTMKARRKSDGEIIEVREWRGASDVIYSSPDMSRFYQASDLDFNVDAEDTEISGWVARDNSGPNDLGLRVYSVKPKRSEGLKRWNGHGEKSTLIDCRLFPDLTWESDPIEVELIIKRKKNGNNSTDNRI